jgi:hypothetical protein
MRDSVSNQPAHTLDSDRIGGLALSKSCMSLNSASSQSLDSLSGVDADSALLTPVRGPPRTRDTYSRGG